MFFPKDWVGTFPQGLWLGLFPSSWVGKSPTGNLGNPGNHHLNLRFPSWDSGESGDSFPKVGVGTVPRVWAGTFPRLWAGNCPKV